MELFIAFMLGYISTFITAMIVYAYKLNKEMGSIEQGAELPDQSVELPDEHVPNLTDLLGSEELQFKNEAIDRKVKALINELEAKKEVGAVYDLPHAATTTNQGEEYAE